MRLMEMAATYRALLDAVEVETGGPETEVLVEGTGEVLSQDAFLAALYAIEDSLEGKVDGYGAVVQELERDAAQLRDIEKRYAARRQALERRAEQVRKALAEGLTAAGKDKVKTLRFTAWLSAEGKELVVENIDGIPDVYFRLPPPPPPKEQLLDRTTLKKVLAAAGGRRDGIAAHLAPTGRRPLNLRIGSAAKET